HTVTRLGRQEFVYGDTRLLGAGNWNYPGRSFDAAKLPLASPGWRTDVFAGKLGQASNKINNPSLAGIYAVRTFDKVNSADVYLLYKGDRIAGNGLDVWTVGMRPKMQFGRTSTTLEVAGQTGRNSGKQMTAAALAAVADYKFAGPVNPRIALQYDYASGG